MRGIDWEVVFVDDDLADDDVFAVMGCLREDASEGIGNKGAAPEIEASARNAISTDVSVLVADAVDGADVDAIGDGMGALAATVGFLAMGFSLRGSRRAPIVGPPANGRS